MSASIPAELQAWIHAETAAGSAPEALLHALRASGWTDAAAIAVLDATLGGDHAHLPRVLDEDVEIAEPPMPAPDLTISPFHVDTLDRRVEVLATVASPRIVLFGNLLSARECTALIAASRRWIQRSPVVDAERGGGKLAEARTSEGCAFLRGHNALVARIEARIASLLNWPLECGEGLQVLRYGPGGEYQPHHDYFDPDSPGSAAELKRGGQRVGTLIMYLKEPERGGATIFPDIGLEIAPKRGAALFFNYSRPHPASRTLHAGAPVVAGEKWIATKWLRQNAHE